MNNKTDEVKLAFAQRLHEAMDAQGYSKRGRARVLSKEFGVSDKGAGKWLNGEAIPETSKIPVLAQFLKTNAEWLLSGSSSNELDNNIVPVTSKLLPVLSWVQAGSMTSVESINPSEIAEWLPPLSSDDPDGCFYLKVVGISNYPTYQDGDYILVNPAFQVCDLLSEDLIVVRNNTDATFKKLIIESDERKYLQALNPNFQPNIIEFEEGMELVGLVIDAFRPLGGSRPKRVRKS
ncbi:MAG: LexA family transcriptional regulator [Acinetobacter sp.]|uniref:S24 family peptidase n=1 Tax=Acinetobacter sp. TaxID=472 RepID=UPI00258BA7C7|nr:S24 family peptidase [Acinetobacter sp.]MCE1270684.1 LexA family transcriptional regulator [Acinetobacter sp.]